MNDNNKYIIRVLCSIFIMLAGIGWGVIFLIDLFINKVPFTAGAAIVPFMSICLIIIGILLFIYLLNEKKQNKNEE